MLQSLALVATQDGLDHDILRRITGLTRSLSVTLRSWYAEPSAVIEWRLADSANSSGIGPAGRLQADARNSSRRF